MILYCVVEGDETVYGNEYKVVKAFASKSRAKAFKADCEAQDEDDDGCSWFNIVELETDLEV